MNNLPQGWVECEFDNVCNIYTGNSINEKEKAERFTNIFDGYNYIATKDISNTHSIDYENGVKIPFGLSKYRLVPQNTSLLCIEGGSAGRKLGFTQQTVCFVNKLCAFVPYSTDINSKFIYYYLQSKKFANYFNKNKTGLIGGVSIQKLKKILICIPPLNEQKRIVEKIEAEFEKIDEGIEKLKLVQEQIKKYKQSVLKSAFEGKLYKITEWKETNIESVSSKVVGGGTPSKNISKYYDGTIPFMTVKDMTSTRPSDTEWHITNEAIKNSSTNLIKKDTIIIATRVGLGKFVRVDFDTTINQDLKAIFLNDKILKDFFEYLYIYKTPEIISKGRGTTVKGITLEDLKSIVFNLPTLEEQQKIVEEIEKRFEVADNVPKIVEENLKKAEQLKQSILKKAFEGRLVPQDPTDEPASVLFERIRKERTK